MGASLVEVNVSPLLMDGEVVGFLGFLRDITEHKRVQKALGEREKNYTELFELHPVINLLTAIIASVVTKLRQASDGLRAARSTAGSYTTAPSTSAGSSSKPHGMCHISTRS